ncbi:MAG: adenosylcobinamide-GDP ribazoletransferase [Planctomycetia bacterium]|nr:adenosylcobinamide-GDP ribazoletransferase [Planctomycetia bacterium]
MHSFLIALAFLSVTPIRFRALPADEAVARSRYWYAAVGLLLGALLAGWTWAAGHLAPPGIAAFLVLLAWVGVTGALHLDGFCDLCDGLCGGWTPEDRLRIMKDPQRGSFAIAGCVLLLLGKYVALVQLLQLSHFPLAAPWAVGVAVLAARCLVLTLAAEARYPRPEGTGKLLIEATRSPEAVAFALLAWGAMILSPRAPLETEPHLAVWLQRFAALDAFYRATLWFVLIWLLLLLLRKQCERRLGGITGDCLGAGIELVELVFLLSVAVSL